MSKQPGLLLCLALWALLGAPGAAAARKRAMAGTHSAVAGREPGGTEELVSHHPIVEVASAESVRVASLTNQCTDADMLLMNNMGPGWEDGTFPGLVNHCGRKSYKWFPFSFVEETHVDCVTETLPITRQCGQCFAGQSKYGFTECKGKCWKNWCTKQCLQCMEAYTELDACVGAVPPVAYACDGTDYNIPTTTSTTSTPIAKEEQEPPDAGVHDQVEPKVPSKPTPEEKQPVVKERTTTTTTAWKQLGACTFADMQAMNKAGPGPDDGSFPKICADCGASSVSWSLSLKEGDYKKCIATSLEDEYQVTISEPCASCFAESASYGIGHCKWDCKSNWCSEGCLSCVEYSHADLNQCVGFVAPPAWACDGSGYGATTTTTTTTTTPKAFDAAEDAEKLLRVGRIVSFFNSATGRFLRMDGTLVGGSVKQPGELIADDERFSVVDASDDASGHSFALYSQSHGCYIKLSDGIGKCDEHLVATAGDAPAAGWSVERLAIVAVGGYGNVKAVALGSVEADPVLPESRTDHFVLMQPDGALAMAKPSTGPVQGGAIPSIMDSKEGTTFVIIDQGAMVSDEVDSAPPAPEPEGDQSFKTRRTKCPAAGPSTMILVFSGLALTLLGGVGGHFLARRRLLGSERTIGWVGTGGANGGDANEVAA